MELEEKIKVVVVQFSHSIETLEKELDAVRKSDEKHRKLVDEMIRERDSIQKELKRFESKTN